MMWAYIKKTATQYGMLGVLEILFKCFSMSMKSSYSSGYGSVSRVSHLSFHSSTLTPEYQKHLLRKQALAKSLILPSLSLNFSYVNSIFPGIAALNC